MVLFRITENEPSKMHNVRPYVYSRPWAEINQSYMLGFPPYRVHTNVDGTFDTPIRYYDQIKSIYFKLM